jgi:hypothetical protein
MNRIVLFENFSNPKYLWPDAKFWIEDLYPEEICFLAIYNDLIQSTKYSKEIIPLFEMEMDDSTHSLEPDYYDEDRGKANFEIFYQIPTKKEKCNIYAEVEAKGGYGPYTPARYMEPAEGGEPILYSIDIESFSYINSDDTFEAIFTDSSYVFKSETIDKKKLMSAIEYLAAMKVEADDETRSVKPEIPEELMKKCESIRKSMPDVVSGSSIISRFTDNDGTK